MEKELENWTIFANDFLSDSIDFTLGEITNLLADMGLVGINELCCVENLEKYIFLHGNEQEIYGYEERYFIECVGSVYIYNDKNRKTNKGMIATKIFVADLSQFDDSVKSCFFFMKVINKANDGFNIFLFKSNDGFFLGCRLYDKDIFRNCALSEEIKIKIEYDELKERLLYISDADEFIPFYSALVESIEYRKAFLPDYDLEIMLKRGVNYSYLETLSDIEKIYHVSFEKAKENYYKLFDAKENFGRSDDYSSINDELKFIKSDRTNTLEMLFEAEEMALLANEAEQENEKLILLPEEKQSTDSVNDKILKEHLNNPELMIKMLKSQKGI